MLRLEDGVRRLEFSKHTFFEGIHELERPALSSPYSLPPPVSNLY